MRKVLNLFLLLCISLLSCKRSFEYKKYYDIDEKQLKILGSFNSGWKEIGHWKYFNLDGTIAQEGNFENGLMEGSWKYNFGSVKKEVEWKRITQRNSKFSVELNLPKNFQAGAFSDLSVISFIDTSSRDVVALKKKNGNEATMAQVLELMKKEFKELYVDGNLEVQKVVLENGSFYFYLYFETTNRTVPLYYFNYIGALGSSDAIVELSYKTENIDGLGKIYFRDILQHTYLDGVRVNNPLEGIKEVI